MGCSSSKLDDLPAVALCRDRCSYLDEAIRLRYALAEAHIAYIKSLKGIGHSLHNFIEQGFVSSHGSLPSPKLNLPPQRKGDPEPSTSPLHHLSHSNSGSHLHFHTDSDDDSGSLHHSDHFSPLHPAHGGHLGYSAADQEVMVQYPVSGGGFMHMNYMKNKATPSVVYEQRPVSPQRVYHMGESSSSSAYFSYPTSNMNMNPYPYYGYGNYGDGAAGFYSSSPPPAYDATSSAIAMASSSKPPPPPPSPPRASAWDFLNPFGSFYNYNAHTPSRDSKEVREEEGIPDLEDDDYREVVKEAYGDQKFVDDSGGGKHSKQVVDDEVDDDTEAPLYRKRAGAKIDDHGVEYEVPVVDKKVVDKEERTEERGDGAAFKGRAPRNVYEVAKEIEVQFERASESGEEIATMLEVGKRPYQRKLVSAKMLHLVTPSLTVVSSKSPISKNPDSSNDNAGSSQPDIVEEMGIRARNLSSTLQKLYLLEKKLYNEVKAEEKMRVLHEKKCRKLKRLDERGAEAVKVDSTQAVIRSLSTRIKIAIQVVDKISVTINKIRDEELWPQLNELIRGLSRMWKCMLECHRIQYQAIRDARSWGPSGGKKPGEVSFEATLELEHELINWTLRFSSWISAQKGYVRALNQWLKKCLLYEPEETADGIVPFSPGRMGAPPVFSICNQWSMALERISEKEVIDSMRDFTSGVLRIWDDHKVEIRRKMMANKDSERKVRSLDREDQKIQKQIQALDKKMELVSANGGGLSLTGRVVYQSDTTNTSLQASLQRVFEAMENFTADSMKVYEELLQRCEEERLNEDRN